MLNEMNFHNNAIKEIIEKRGNIIPKDFFPKTLEEMHWILCLSIKYEIKNSTINDYKTMKEIRETILTENDGWINHGFFTPDEDYNYHKDPLWKLFHNLMKNNKRYLIRYISVDIENYNRVFDFFLTPEKQNA